jgi:hypothetical protein
MLSYPLFAQLVIGGSDPMKDPRLDTSKDKNRVNVANINSLLNKRFAVI